jgi:3-deoxy-manno-octulosonate cytidylyltransferase (CMP-KDO synthetase)
MGFWVLIPARAGSTRLPDKPLLNIVGKPMISYVIETAKKSGANKVIVATDDERVKIVSEKSGAVSLMTKGEHLSGSDRIAEAAELLDAADDQIIVNLQGDEPLMPFNVIKRVAKLKQENPDISVTTVATPITNKSEINSTNCVKVVLNNQSEAIYFSRSVIPHQRDNLKNNGDSIKEAFFSNDKISYLRHLGIYCFQARDLKRFVSWGPCALELNEKLEQLRWLWYRKTIKVIIESQNPAHGVDTKEDLIKIRAMMQEKKLK